MTYYRSYKQEANSNFISWDNINKLEKITSENSIFKKLEDAFRRSSTSKNFVIIKNIHHLQGLKPGKILYDISDFKLFEYEQDKKTVKTLIFMEKAATYKSTTRIAAADVLNPKIFAILKEDPKSSIDYIDIIKDTYKTDPKLLNKMIKITLDSLSDNARLYYEINGGC